jgi:hypothetical protein
MGHIRMLEMGTRALSRAAAAKNVRKEELVEDIPD